MVLRPLILVVNTSNVEGQHWKLCKASNAASTARIDVEFSHLGRQWETDRYNFFWPVWKETTLLEGMVRLKNLPLTACSLFFLLRWQ